MIILQLQCVKRQSVNMRTRSGHTSSIHVLGPMIADITQCHPGDLETQSDDYKVVT